MTESKKPLTVYIGRFSPFHMGHLSVLRRALRTSENVLVLVGSCGRARDLKNPFTFDERAEMIHRAALGVNHNATLMVMPIRDYIYNDQKWITQVQERVEEFKREQLTPGKAYLTGSDRDESTWYLGAFGDYFLDDLVEAIDLEVNMSATAIRDALFSAKAESQQKGVSVQDLNIFKNLDLFVTGSTYRFLLEFIQKPCYLDLVKEYEFIQSHKAKWSVAPYKPVFSTVDACVIQSGHVLVNVRDNFPGTGLWALPGGYLEQDERLVDGAIRELQEETKIGLAPAQLRGSIKAKEIFDHPSRSARGRIVTTCFLFRLDDTKALPKVKPQAGEVKKVMWVPLAEALSNTDAWFEDHLEILEWAVDQLK